MPFKLVVRVEERFRFGFRKKQNYTLFTSGLNQVHFIFCLFYCLANDSHKSTVLAYNVKTQQREQNEGRFSLRYVKKTPDNFWRKNLHSQVGTENPNNIVPPVGFKQGSKK